MIKVTIELIPAFGGPIKHLGTGYIMNDGTGTKTKGNYKVRFLQRNGSRWKEGKVKDFPRRKLLAWDLLYRSLKAIVRDRND